MEMIINLHQRVVLIAGPVTSTVSSIVINLTRLGADCVILDPEKTAGTAFTNQINDAREINDKFGRALLIQSELNTAAQIKDAVGKAAQTFGGLDVYIDAMMIQSPTPMDFSGDIHDFSGLIDKHLKLPMMLTQSVMAYLKGRKKGRVIFLYNECPIANIKEDIAAQAVRGGLVKFAQSLAKQTSDYNVTVNAMSIALTEEYVLAHDPDSKSIKVAMEKMKSIDPSLKLTEPEKVSQTIAFIVSPMGATINGYNFNLS